jgi:hypothetical protein
MLLRIFSSGSASIISSKKEGKMIPFRRAANAENRLAVRSKNLN